LVKLSAEKYSSVLNQEQGVTPSVKVRNSTPNEDSVPFVPTPLTLDILKNLGNVLLLWTQLPPSDDEISETLQQFTNFTLIFVETLVKFLKFLNSYSRDENSDLKIDTNIDFIAITKILQTLKTNHKNNAKITELILSAEKFLSGQKKPGRSQSMPPIVLPEIVEGAKKKSAKGKEKGKEKEKEKGKEKEKEKGKEEGKEKKKNKRNSTTTSKKKSTPRKKEESPSPTSSPSSSVVSSSPREKKAKTKKDKLKESDHVKKSPSKLKKGSGKVSVSNSLVSVTTQKNLLTFLKDFFRFFQTNSV
jgi:hypothetical protein